MDCELEFSSGAAREFTKLPPQIQGRLAHKIGDLTENPRPARCEKLSGLDAYRIRVGDYRIVYFIDDSQAIVTIATIGHRRDVYRRS